MNIKKLFATLAGVSLFAQTVVPSAGVFGATYSEELQGAYSWAYSKGVTTMNSIDNANMYGAITRAEMAKMLSVYAVEVLGLTENEARACNFTDIDSVKGDLHDYIIKSCKLGIMGQGITAFRPYDTLSRAEFGTALSRVLWGDKYEGGTPYYANHLNALKAAGIMNQIANAEQTKEVRGYVMLMLQRSEANAEDVSSKCDDPAIKLACELDSDECPAACRNNNNEEEDEDVVVKSGSLEVSSSSAEDRSVVVTSITWATAVSDLDTLTFATSEEVTLSKVVLEKYGYSNSSDLIANIWLENEDGKEISNKATPNSKGLVNLTMKKDYKTVDGKLNAIIVIETKSIASGAKVGGTIGFKVNDVVSTAKDVDLGNYKAYKYDVVAYDGTTAKIIAKGWKKDYNYEGKAVEISKFKIKAPDDSAIEVNSFTLTNTGTLNIHDTIDVDDVEVSIDGKDVKANVSINKDQEMTVSLKDSLEISAKAQAEVIISTKFNSDLENYGRTIYLKIAKTSDLSATDKNNARITVDNTTSAKWVEYTINGGQVKITNTKLGNVDASINSTDILIASGYITVSEDIEKWVLTLSFGTSGAAIEAVKLTFAGDDYDGETTDNGNTWTFKNLEASESGKLRIYVDIDDKSQYEGTVFNPTIAGWNTFYYSNSKSTTPDVDISGTLTISKLTITQPEGSLVNNLSSSDDVEFTNKETNTEIVFDGTYTADKQDIKLNSFTIVNPAYTWDSEIRFYLYVDDMNSSVADAKVTKTSLTGSDTFKDVLVEAGKSVRVRVEAEVKANETTTPAKAGKFNLILDGEDENDNDAGHAERKTANMVIVDKGSVSITDSSVAKKAVLRKASSAKIAEFTVKPDGANSVSLESIEFDLTFSGASAYQGDVDLYVGGSKKKLSVNGNHYSADFNTNVDSNGVVVYVEINDEFDGSAKITNLLVNGKSTGKEFDKKFVDAIVWFTSQSFWQSKTTFKLGVDKKKDSTTISKLVLTFADSSTWSINEWNEIKAWVSYDVDNASWAAKNVTAISFTIDATAATPAVHWTYTGSCTSGTIVMTGTSASADKTACETAAGTYTGSCDVAGVVMTGTNVDTDKATCEAAVKTAGTAAGGTNVSYDSANYPDMFRLGMKEDGDRVYVEKIKN